MAADVEVVICYGPLDWFTGILDGEDHESLLTLMLEEDTVRRQLVVTNPSAEPAVADVPPRPALVSMTSGEYASLREHVITNFAWEVSRLNPRKLVVQNPPAPVRDQLQRTFPTTTVEEFTYPALTVEQLLQIHDNFDSAVVGQTQAKAQLLSALYKLTTPGRTAPVVVMFYGPSGVGKTETAQFVNRVAKGTLLRKQFSMFHSEKFASYLFGASHSEPSLARDLLDREPGVILIDEFDKANPMFHSAFYELFDGGAFEDKNYRVNVGPALIVCTSNWATEAEVQEALGDALFSRFDAAIEFTTLTEVETITVIDRMIDRRFDKSSDPRMADLNSEELRGKLHRAATQSPNIRQLAKLVDEVIARSLVRNLLAASRQAADDDPRDGVPPPSD
ncbi:peptidase S14 [Curtobacterium sp. BH-2-1-1]|uniref:AAA family ATPase n=1 Tax=Curtobacterium sp. BH-2-1-1 TaxID=1905847 RepID=UPI00089DF204|nr:AAA family ATPase [Curtobacterium sp. BH-2-1-1]AOX65735.1 peptidase S14 [Curtobacterium sp. BH-2-1-1]